MLQPNIQRYFLYNHSTDMRKGVDSLCGLVRNKMGGDLLSGDGFVFLNSQRNRLKLLVWDRTGFVLYYKRLSKGTYERPKSDEHGKSQPINSTQLMCMLEGIQLSSIRYRKRYELKKIA